MEEASQSIQEQIPLQSKISMRKSSTKSVEVRHTRERCEIIFRPVKRNNDQNRTSCQLGPRWRPDQPCALYGPSARSRGERLGLTRPGKKIVIEMCTPIRAVPDVVYKTYESHSNCKSMEHVQHAEDLPVLFKSITITTRRPQIPHVELRVMESKRDHTIHC